MNWMKKYIAAVCIACLGSFFLWGCQKQNTDRQSDNMPELIIGLDGNYEPYTYVDEDGELAGLDIELATEACRRMGMKPVFQAVKWDDKDTDLENGSIDCIWSCYTMTGREDMYLWAGPYMNSRQVVVVRDDSEVWKLEDLTGKKVAVMSSTKPEGIFLEHGEGIPAVDEMYCMEDMELAFAALQENFVEATAGHETVIRQYMDMAPGQYRILEESLMTVKVGVAFYKQGAADTVKRLNDALQAMRDNGTIYGILEQYGIYSEKTDGGGAF